MESEGKGEDAFGAVVQWLRESGEGRSNDEGEKQQNRGELKASGPSE